MGRRKKNTEKKKEERRIPPELSIPLPPPRSSRRVSQDSRMSALSGGGVSRAARRSFPLDNDADQQRSPLRQGGGGGDGGRRSERPPQRISAGYRAAVNNRRASVETIGAMTAVSGLHRSMSSDVMTVEMQALQFPDDDNDNDHVAGAGEEDQHVGVSTVSFRGVVREYDHNADSDDDDDDDNDNNGNGAAEEQKGGEQQHQQKQPQPQPESHNPRQLRRQASRRRQRDVNDFRTSITTVAGTTKPMSDEQMQQILQPMPDIMQPDRHNIVSSTDENPSFWGVSNRWFSDAGDFVGELTGMATRRISDGDENEPRTEGVDIECAADYDDDENDNDNDDDDENNHGTSNVEDGLLSNSSLNSIPNPFDELSSLGDTPTGLMTSQTRKHVLRGAWFLTLSIMMLYVASQAIWHSSSAFSEWSSNNSNRGRVSGTSSNKRRSRRYWKMKKRLVVTFGNEVFMEEESPQHRALEFLADGDALALNPIDPHDAPQLMQRYALAVFYFSTHGAQWKSRTYWLTGRHECGWLFVICSDVKEGTSDADGNNSRGVNVTAIADDDYANLMDSELGLGEGRVVTGLSLFDQNLQGLIPKEIATLEFLHVLDLGNNNLEGRIGTEFGRLQHLRKLYLESNNLRGGAEALAWLGALKRVNVENNRLSGTLPYDLGKLKHLEEVRMGQNKLQGSIPSSLLRSKTLTKLDLHGNKLTGTLVVNEASILNYLYLSDNNLSGELTTGVLCSVSSTLIDLRLNNNSFSGKIPNIANDCTMDKLELLSLAKNGLGGPIHNSVGGERMPRLREVHLYENKLLSTIPRSIFRPENLTAVLLGNNVLTGTLSADMVKNARNLLHFYVNSNKLSGNLDDFAQATSLDNLKKLRLENNIFTGSIPKMNANLELLYLYNNRFSGTLDNLGSAVNLRKLKLSNNTLEGEITPTLGELKKLQVLSLDGNNFVGTLPTELQELKALQELQVEHNDIVGSVPQGVCDLRKSLLEKLVSDCGGTQPEVACSCCTECV